MSYFLPEKHSYFIIITKTQCSGFALQLNPKTGGFEQSVGTPLKLHDNIQSTIIGTYDVFVLLLISR